MKGIRNFCFSLLATALIFSAVTGCDQEAKENQGELTVSGAVIDVHTHLISAEFLTLGHGAPSGSPASEAEDLIARLDEANVEKAVVLSTAYMAKSAESMSAENDWVATEVAKYPERLIGFCGINPLLDTAVNEINRCLRIPEMIGVKLQLVGSKLNMANDAHVAALVAVFDAVQKKDAPILIHVGAPLGLPLDADGLANVARVIATHPNVRVVHAHCAGNTDDQEIELWLKGMVASPPAFSAENFFLDVSACLKFYRDAPLAKRELLVWRFKKWGLNRVFFGSDYLMVSPQETPLEALETLSMYPFTQEEIDLITSNDASEWLFSGLPEASSQPAHKLELLAEIESYIEQSRKSLNVPGVAVAIVQGGEIVFAEGFGVKDIGSDDPVTADTIFSIGSLGKAVTSMMVASLVDDGLIEWDTPLVDVMPQFRLSDEQSMQQITLREAFAHTSGLPNLGPVLFLSGRSPEDWIDYLADVPLAAPLGESYAYQNEMYSVGGYAAAMTAGAEYGENLLSTYVELMKKRVFDPLELTTATFSAEEVSDSPNHASPHFMSLNATLADTGFDVTPTHYWDVKTAAPAGVVRMSASDVGRFLITMLSGGVAPDGSRAFSAANLAETWVEQIALEPDPFLDQKGSALGWSTVTYQGIPLVTKDGNLGGFAAQMAFIPEVDLGIVVLSNADVLGSLLGRNVQYRLIEMFFELEPRIDEVAAAELEGISELSDVYSQLSVVNPEIIAPFLGSYKAEGEPYTVELRDGRLWVSLGQLDFVELLEAPDGSYLAISGGELLLAPFQFVEGDDGKITMVIFGQLELLKLDSPVE
jgi:CubicO group peptidase (beta-lactamase class C family)/predicted TIM-barrel fold metal-dependent hydrolase